MNKHKNPIMFHGKHKKNNFFEGWYYKHVTKDKKSSISFIPGVSLTGSTSHAFIQCIYLDELGFMTSYYFYYPIEVFNYQQQPFQITIDKSIFTENYIHIELQDEVTHIQGELEFEHLTPIKRNILNPNIMGFFSYIPRMECNHGIISMHHLLKGNVIFETNNNRKVIDFDKGIGYIEKDWGTSFPKEYMWVQTNHFNQEDISLFFTMAEIPFLKTKFRGFICNLVIQDQEYRFATYNNAKLQVRRFSEHDFDVVVSRGNLKLRIKGKLINSQELASPSAGYMTKTIKEGLAGKIKLQLKNNQGEILLNTIGECCGLELMKKEN